MTADEKLAAILAAVQTDPGNRGLGRVPGDNLFTACAGDFAAACRSLAGPVRIVTGFCIPSATPPAFETDGPLGAVFLARACAALGIVSEVDGEIPVLRACRSTGSPLTLTLSPEAGARGPAKHVVFLERGGPAADGRRYTMRGRDIAAHLDATHEAVPPTAITIGIGDGGNEIGMGKIPHETIVANIPNGDLIHCRVPTDHLIVAGVSNWGAYALAAGLFVLRGIAPPPDLFDPDREREILEVMVRDGPLVDGVTGQQTATVDGLTWDEYAKPLVRIAEILRA